MEAAGLKLTISASSPTPGTCRPALPTGRSSHGRQGSSRAGTRLSCRGCADACECCCAQAAPRPAQNMRGHCKGGGRGKNQKGAANHGGNGCLKALRHKRCDNLLALPTSGCSQLACSPIVHNTSMSRFRHNLTEMFRERRCAEDDRKLSGLCVTLAQPRHLAEGRSITCRPATEDRDQQIHQCEGLGVIDVHPLPLLLLPLPRSWNREAVWIALSTQRRDSTARLLAAMGH